MRTTLTIDADVAALLEKENRRAREPMKQTINRALRCGLKQQAAQPKLPRFVVRSRKLGVPEEWFEGSTQDLFDRLDGPFAR